MRIIGIIHDQIIDAFLNHLKASGLSKNSIKFYKSDVLLFSTWVVNKTKSLGVAAESFKETLPFLKPSFAEEYKTHLIECKSSHKTVNRQLSTLRNFADFLNTSGHTSFNLAQNLVNLSLSVTKEKKKDPDEILNLIEAFEMHLESQKASKNTIKNYLADVKHFFSWLELNHA
jgi:site-specific recombinase XerD